MNDLKHYVTLRIQFSCFNLLKLCFQEAMIMLYNSLFLRIIRNIGLMSWVQNCSNVLLTYPDPLSIFMMFWAPMHEKHFKQCVIACLVVSPVCAVSIKNPEYVSIVTCTYLNFPNSVTWVTFICHIWYRSSPWRLPPNEVQVSIVVISHFA